MKRAKLTLTLEDVAPPKVKCFKKTMNVSHGSASILGIHAYEVFDQMPSGIREDGFRMELDALYRIIPVPQSHEFPFLSPGTHDQAFRESLSIDDQ